MAIIKVPLELRTRFLNSRANFIRDVCCFPLESVSPFFRRRNMISKVIDHNRVNPLDEFSLNFVNYQPINYDAPRYLHFDLAISGDNVGIGCCHASHFVSRIVSKGSQTEKTLVPFVYFDFIGRIQAEKGQDIILDDIVNIVYKTSELGLYVALVTFDRFQSVSSIQNLRRDGFTSAVLSIDRTAYRIILDKHAEDGYKRESTTRQYSAAMQTFKDQMYQERVSIPFHEHYESEAKGAEYDERSTKVTHSSLSTIDMLQAIAGSSYNCENNAYPVVSQDHENYMKATGDHFYQGYQTPVSRENLDTGDAQDPFYKELDNEESF